MPPEIIGELLWTAILFPWPLKLKRIRVHQENAARAVSAGRAQRAAIDAIGAAMNGVRRCVAGFFDELFRLNHLHDLRLPRGLLRVQDMNPGRADTRHDQVAALHVRMWSLRTE